MLVAVRAASLCVCDRLLAAIDIKLIKMSCMPPGAFAAHKVRQNMMKSSWEDKSLAIIKKVPEKQIPHIQFAETNKKLVEHPPAKYNSKLMNSIWGLYNRYSVHNLKKVADTEDVFARGGQQRIAVASPASLIKGGPQNGPYTFSWETLTSSVC